MAGTGALVIHLARAQQRRANVEQIVRNCPVPTTILDAVDAAAMTDHDRDAVYVPKGLFQPKYPFKLEHGEIACFLSHRKAWQYIVDKGWDYGLIFEDDVELAADFGAAYQFAIDHIQQGDYIRFPTRTGERPLGSISNSGKFALFPPKVTGVGMCGQILTANAATALLEFTKCFDRPVDTTIQLRWLHEVKTRTLHPALVTEISSRLEGSLIQIRKKSTLERLRREVSRFIYRAKVYALSRQHHKKRAIEARLRPHAPEGTSNA